MRLIFFLITIPIITLVFGVTLFILGIIIMILFIEDIFFKQEVKMSMSTAEAYHELLEEILNGLEEAMVDENWDGIDSVMHQIREAIDNPYDNYNTEEW